jgi:hypothetical protein
VRQGRVRRPHAPLPRLLAETHRQPKAVPDCLRGRTEQPLPSKARQTNAAGCRRAFAATALAANQPTNHPSIHPSIHPGQSLEPPTPRSLVLLQRRQRLLPPHVGARRRDGLVRAVAAKDGDEDGEDGGGGEPVARGAHHAEGRVLALAVGGGLGGGVGWGLRVRGGAGVDGCGLLLTCTSDSAILPTRIKPGVLPLARYDRHAARQLTPMSA